MKVVEIFLAARFVFSCMHVLINFTLNKTENHFSHYPRSQVDINSYTRLKIAMSLIAGKA
jgi:hypothetical protein